MITLTAAVSELWKVYKSYAGTPMTDADYDLLLEKVTDITRMSGDDSLVRDMGVAFISDIEKKSKEFKI